MRLIFAPLLVLAGLIWSMYEWLIKKNGKMARVVLSITIFFGSVWGLIFYWIFAS